MEFRIGKILSQYASADRGSAQALFLDRDLQLLHSELWKLQGERSESPKALRPGCTELQLLVLNLDDRSGGVAVLAVPERIYGEYLHVDRHRVHFLQTLFNDDEVLGNSLHRRQHLIRSIAHQLKRFMEITMRVNVDG